MVSIDGLSAVLGVAFNDPQLYETAMTHRSFLNERHRYDEHNERLEFLGDAVLELVVTEYLFRNYSQPEGVLTNWRSALVKTESLSGVAAKLGIEEFLRLSRGERKGSDRARRQILANAVEALIGAIYLDHGYKEVEAFITRVLIAGLKQIIDEGSWQDAKTKYQELMQERESFTPEYRVLEESGPDHDKRFRVGVYIDGELRGEGNGSSKQSAQQKAAAAALVKMAASD